MTADQLGTAIVDSYYAETSDNETLALVDLETMPALQAAVSTLADALLAHPSLFAAVETARQSAQMFYSLDEHRDLVAAATEIAAAPGAQGTLTGAATAVVDQLTTTIVHSRSQSSHPGAHGLAIYFPAHGGGLDAAYTGPGAVWSEQTHWDEFLEAFTQ